GSSVILLTNESAVGHVREEREDFALHALARLRRVLVGEAIHDGTDGVLSRAQLEHVGGGGIEDQTAFGIQQQVTRRARVPAQPGFGRHDRPAVGRDRAWLAHTRAPPGPQPGSTYAT